MQTQIRLLLKEQSDQGPDYLQYCLHLLDALLDGKTFSSFRMLTAKFSSVSKFWNLMVKPLFSSFRMLSAKFSSVPKFWNFPVL